MRTQRRDAASRSREDIFERLLARARQAAGRYGAYALAAALVLVVALLVHHNYRARLRREQARAWQELSEMPGLSPNDGTPEWQEQTRQIISRCKSMLADRWETDATAWVLLKLANAQRAAGELEDALQSYRRLRQEYEGHYAATLTGPNVAGLLEEMGRYREAAAAYEEIAREQGGRSRLWLDAGRSWELAGEREAAIRAYRQIAGSADEADNEAAAIAAGRLDDLEAGRPLLEPPPPRPARQTEPEQQAPVGEQPAGPAPEGELQSEASAPESEPAPEAQSQDSP